MIVHKPHYCRYHTHNTNLVAKSLPPTTFFFLFLFWEASVPVLVKSKIEALEFCFAILF